MQRNVVGGNGGIYQLYTQGRPPVRTGFGEQVLAWIDEHPDRFMLGLDMYDNLPAPADTAAFYASVANYETFLSSTRWTSTGIVLNWATQRKVLWENASRLFGS